MGELRLPEGVTPYYHDPDAGIVLYCGDCREILPRMQAGSVDLVLTDPPYAISVAGSSYVGMPGKGTRRLDFFAGDDDWLSMTGRAVDVVANCIPLLAESGSLYVWCGHRQFGPLIAHLESEGYSTRFLVWAKAVPVPPPPGSGWPSGAELCVYAYKTGRCWNHRGSDVPRSNVIVADSFRFGQPGKVDHPTQKPMTVIIPLIRASSRPRAVILDPFTGSGTTLVAAKMLGRQAIGIELEERYCAIAVERLRQAVLPLLATPLPRQLSLEAPDA